MCQASCDMDIWIIRSHACFNQSHKDQLDQNQKQAQANRSWGSALGKHVLTDKQANEKGNHNCDAGGFLLCMREPSPRELSTSGTEPGPELPQ